MTDSKATSTIGDYHSEEIGLSHIDDLVIVISWENLRAVDKINSCWVHSDITVDVMVDVLSLTEQLAASG